MARGKILVADDEPAVRFGIRDFLEAHGHEVIEGQSWQDALELLRNAEPDVAIIDHKQPDGLAVGLLAQLRQVDPDVPLVILTGHGSIELAVQAIKEGAEHFLTKPMELPALLVVVRRLVEARRSRQRHLAAQSGAARSEVDPFLGESQAIHRLAKEAGKVQASDSPVFILGETGTGKGLLARWLHDDGPLADGAFVDFNCAGLSREFWRPSCSATRGGRSRARSAASRASWRWPTRAPSSSTRSATSTCTCSPSSSRSSRKSASGDWAMSGTATWTSG